METLPPLVDPDWMVGRLADFIRFERSKQLGSLKSFENLDFLGGARISVETRENLGKADKLPPKGSLFQVTNSSRGDRGHRFRRLRHRTGFQPRPGGESGSCTLPQIPALRKASRVGAGFVRESTPPPKGRHRRVMPRSRSSRGCGCAQEQR